MFFITQCSTVKTETPQMESVDLLAFGGLLGLFWGFSLLSFIEFFDVAGK